MSARLLVKGAVLSGILILTLHVLRKPLFESLLIGLLEEVVGEQLDGDASIRALDGSWVSDIQVRGLELWDGRGALRSIQDGSLLLGYSLPALLLGRPEGLRSAELRAGSITVVPGSRDGSHGGDSSGVDWSALSEAVPDGVDVRVDELRVGRGESARRAPLRAKLLPLALHRSFTLNWGELELSLELSGTEIGARLAAGSPGALARALGLEQPIRDGKLALDFSLRTEAPGQAVRLIGRGKLDGARLGTRSIRRASFAFSMAGDRLDVQEIDVGLPGLTLSGKALSLPLVSLTTEELLESLEGEVDLEIEDLGPYRDWFRKTAPELAPYLPLRGRLRGSLGGGKLELSDCSFEGEGFELDSSGGELPLDPGFLGGSGSGRIDFDLRLLEPAPLQLGGFEAMPWSARLTGTVEGSLREPRVKAELALRSGSSTHLSGRVRYTPSSRELACRLSGRLAGLARSGESHGLPPVEVSLDGKAVLPERGHVRGHASLSLSGVHLERKLELRGKLKLNEAGELLSDKLELIMKAGDGADRVLAMAEGRVPALGGETMRIRADITKLPLAALEGIPGLPPGLEGEGGLELEVTGRLEDPEIRCALSASVETGALGELWPRELLGEAPGPLYGLVLRLTGRLSALSVVEMTLSASTEMRSLRLACAGDLPLRCTFDGTVSERRTASPLAGRLEIGGSAGADLSADFSIQHDRVGVDRLECRLGPATATGRLEIEMPLAEVCRRPESLGAARLSGRLEMNRFSLEGFSVPGLEDSRGRLEGTAEVEGTLALPKPRIELLVSDAELKTPGLPRIEELRAKLRVLPNRIEVKELEGRVGAGDLRADLSFDTGSRLLWRGYDTGAVRVSVHGEDVLLAHTADLKLRGTFDLEATGPADDIRVEGNVDLVGGKYAKRVSALPDFALRGGTRPDSGFSPFRLTSELGRRISFNYVRIRTAKPVRLRTELIDCDLDGALSLSGPAVKPYFVGTVSGSEGTLRLPGVTLEITSILLGFEQARPYHPTILMKASGRRLGYRIQLTVSGLDHQPEVVLTSVPPLPPEDLLVLVSTGYTPGLLRANNAQNNLTLLGTYLLSELYASITGGANAEDKESIFDRITIESGSEIGAGGEESIRVELGLSDKFYLVLERDIYGDYNVRPGFRLRF